MRPSMMMGGRGLPRATYVGSAFQYLLYSTDIMTIDLAGAGAQLGDFCLIHIQNLADRIYSEVVGGGAGWERDNFTWSGHGYRNSILRKRLNSLTPPQLRASGENGLMNVTTMVYRGPNAAQRRVIYQDSDGDSTHATPGFARSANCVGVVGFLADRNPTTGGTVTSPGGTITKRRDDQYSYFRTLAVDALPRAAYVDGAAVNWTGLLGPDPDVSQLYELLIA